MCLCNSLSGQLLTIADGPVEAVLDRLGVHFKVKTLRFEPSLGAATPITFAEGFRIRAPVL